jgi:hypothetical protein
VRHNPPDGGLCLLIVVYGFKVMNDFLKAEYEQCYSLLKYYDERHQSLVKYATGMTSAVPTLLYMVFQIGDSTSQYFWHFTFIISILLSIGLLSIYTVLIQTRLYFIYPARQLNAIRKYCIDELNQQSFENQMYTSTTFNAFKLLSTQSMLNLFVALQAGIFASLSMFSYKMLENKLECIISSSLSAGLIYSFLLFFLSAYYLHTSSDYHPDKSIHKEMKQNDIKN